MATAGNLESSVGPNGRLARRLILTEGLILLLSAPALLFPERFPVLTLVALLALAGVWLLSLVLLRRPALPATPLNLALLLFSIMVGVAIVASADAAATIDKATGTILGLGVWRFLTLAVESRRQFAAAFVAFTLLSLGLAVVGFLSIGVVAKIPAIGRLLPGLTALPTQPPLEVHPNQVAGLICLFLPALLSVMAAERKALGRLLLAAATLVAGLILLLTQSRGGWIGFLAGTIVLLTLWGLALPPSTARRIVRGALLAIIVAAAALLLWFGPQQVQEFWLDPPESSVVGDLTTLNYRRQLWPWAVSAVTDFPLTGVGLGAFRVVGPRLYPLDITPGQDFGHAHNMFLQIALDVGLPGLVGYVALLLAAAAAGWGARHDRFLRPYALGLLAGLAAFHVYGLADAVALGAKPGLVFWYTIGLLTVVTKRRFHEHTTDH